MHQPTLHIDPPKECRMSKPNHLSTSTDLNTLRRKAHYRAITDYGVVMGQYLGMEAPYGDKAILLRHASGTSSVPITSLLAIAETHAA